MATLTPTWTATPALTPLGNGGFAVRPNRIHAGLEALFSGSEAFSVVEIRNVAGEMAGRIRTDSNGQARWVSGSLAPGLYLATARDRSGGRATRILLLTR